MSSALAESGNSFNIGLNYWYSTKSLEIILSLTTAAKLLTVMDDERIPQLKYTYIYYLNTKCLKKNENQNIHKSDKR